MNYKSLSIYSFFAVACFAFAVVSCNNEKKPTESKTTHKSKTIQMITNQEIIDAQNIWGEGIISIGKVFLAGGNYTNAAEDHIDALYGYHLGKVLFKPTLASQNQFRLTKEGALSYFVGHNPAFAEDHGFAIRPWSKVRWERIGTHIEGNLAVAMGNYFFTPHSGGDEVKVEYTFGYIKDASGKLRIILHGSHLPYAPN